ncbi:hypothetical protein L3X38_037378 [Prunus dulcis]|uniref:Zinc knuckle CX2CX4HX4C domain-containing protein n=1 Tax=Prunus dulcis TaxID=3755 RepID=A0AAD4V535_PRUDU|nr:hypothetical protein L3X38_037378 [Prunus dulcis]
MGERGISLSAGEPTLDDFGTSLEQQLVLTAQEKAYRRSLVLLAETPDDGSIHIVPLHYGTFWVQLHGIPGFCMTIAIAQTIGAIFGEGLWVDNRDGDDCVGRYFDVDLPLIHRTPVTLPDIGERLIEFKYEYLPEYCFACGRLGHSTQVCVRGYEEVHGWFTIPSLNQFTTAFAGLEANTNL